MEFSLIELLSLIFVSIPFTVICIFVLIKLCKAVIDDIKKQREINLYNMVSFRRIDDALTNLNKNISVNNDYLVHIISKSLDEE